MSPALDLLRQLLPLVASDSATDHQFRSALRHLLLRSWTHLSEYQAFLGDLVEQAAPTLVELARALPSCRPDCIVDRARALLELLGDRRRLGSVVANDAENGASQ